MTFARLDLCKYLHSKCSRGNRGARDSVAGFRAQAASAWEGRSGRDVGWWRGGKMRLLSPGFGTFASGVRKKLPVQRPVISGRGKGGFGARVMRLGIAVRLGGIGGLLAVWCASATITLEPWAPMFRGVDFARGEADANEARLQKVFALRVDLHDPTVEFFSTPANGDRPKETDGQTTAAFVQSYGVSVGVNANFFSPVNYTPNDPRDLNGLAVSRGEVVSALENGFPAVMITRSNAVGFVSQAPGSLANVWTAVAGSDLILVNGQAKMADCNTEFCKPHPRTAVGLSAQRRYFYLMVIDGRRPGWSDGATLYETGQWLLRLGAWNGLNLDGGGSSAMARLTNGAAVVMNRPSDWLPRVNGNHLGVFAQPLAPALLAQPTNRTVSVGQPATFHVGVVGAPPLYFQWRFNGVSLTGATEAACTIGSAQMAHGGWYSVVVSNAWGAVVSSNALLSVQEEGSLVGRLFGAQKDGEVFSVWLQADTVGKYSLEWRDPPAESNWSAWPAVNGNGAALQLVDPQATNALRLYRVRRW